MPKYKFISTIIKFGDVDTYDILPETNIFLSSIAPTYEDKAEHCNENLIDIEDILEAIQNENEHLTFHPDAIHEAEQIYKEMDKRECAYLRLITN